MHTVTCLFAFDFTDIYIFASGANPFDEDLYPLTTGTNSMHYFRLKDMTGLHMLFDEIIGEASTSSLCSFIPSSIFIFHDDSECWTCVLLCFHSDDEEVKGLCGLHVEHTVYTKKTMYPWMAFIFIRVNLLCSFVI